MIPHNLAPHQISNDVVNCSRRARRSLAEVFEAGRRKAPCQRGSGEGLRQQAGLDGLGSVPRLLFSGTVVPASQLPTRNHILRTAPVCNNGSRGMIFRYRGISTPLKTQRLPRIARFAVRIAPVECAGPKGAVKADAASERINPYSTGSDFLSCGWYCRPSNLYVIVRTVFAVSEKARMFRKPFDLVVRTSSSWAGALRTN